MTHLTCVGADVAGLRVVLDEVEAAGIDNLLALRGDSRPGGDGPFIAPRWPPRARDGSYGARRRDGRRFLRWWCGDAHRVDGPLDSPSLCAAQSCGRRVFFITQLSTTSATSRSSLVRGARSLVRRSSRERPSPTPIRSRASPACGATMTARRALDGRKSVLDKAWPTQRCNALIYWRAVFPRSISTR